jgi:hypothetical protein
LRVDFLLDFFFRQTNAFFGGKAAKFGARLLRKRPISLSDWRRRRSISSSVCVIIRVFSASASRRAFSRFDSIRFRARRACFGRSQLRERRLTFFFGANQFGANRFASGFESVAQRLAQKINDDGDENREIDKLPRFKARIIQIRLKPGISAAAFTAGSKIKIKL